MSYLGLAYARNGQYADAYQAFLQAGEDDLADEMAQYLTEEQRIELRSAAVGQALVSPNQIADRASDSVMFSMQGTVELREDDVDEVVIDEAPAAIESVEEFSLDDALDNALVEHVATASAPAERSAPPAERSVLPTERSVLPTERSAPPAERAVAVPMPAPTPTPRRREKGPGAISQAVALAIPSSAAAAGAARVAAGNQPPMALFEFATAKLIRPDDGDSVFELTAAGVLIVRVNGRIYTRTEGVNVTGGELAYEVAARRARGSSGGEEFSSDGRPLFVVSGRGHLLASPIDEHFTAVTLDRDILYLREDLVFAFEDELRWENGHVPGSNATIRMVQFRGQGSVAFRSKRPLLAIKLASERVLHVDAHVLAGWIGRVIPRAVTPAAGGETSTLFVECTGEGVILVEEESEDEAPNTTDSSRPVLAGARRVESSS